MNTDKIKIIYEKIKNYDFEKIWQILDTPIFIESFETLFSNGIEAFANKNYFRSLQFFKKAYMLKKDDPYLLCNYALANQMLDNNREAIALYLKSLKLDPQNADVFYNLGLLYDKEKRYEKAIENFEKSFQIKPEKSCLVSLAYVYSEIKRFDDSFNTIMKVVNPKDERTFECLFNLAYENEGKNAYNKKNNDHIEFSIKLYKQVIFLDEKHYNSFFQLAKCYSKLANWNEAAKFCEKALNLLPESFDANYHMGIILFYNENIDEAVEFFKKAIAIDPKQTADVYLSLSYAYEKQSLLSDAINILLDATKIFKDQEQLHIIRINLKRLLNLKKHPQIVDP